MISLRMMSLLTALLLMTCFFTLVPDGTGGNDTRDALDATIEGTVVNGTAGMPVIISSTRTPSSGNPFTVFFNTTTDASGSFSADVDTNDSSPSPTYTMGLYSVVVSPTYYTEVVSGAFQFLKFIEEGETFTVPAGVLEARPAEVGNLTVRILNGSSGEPMEGAVVSVEHVPVVPEIPFSQSRVTDMAGEVTYTDIRAVETEVDATKLHFMDLSSTVDDNTVEITAGGNDLAQFNLTEDPWPFSTIPTDDASAANVTNGILVDFQQPMDVDSVNSSGNYVLERIGGDRLSFNISILDPSGERVRIVPDRRMDYDSDYHFAVMATVRSQGGGVPLWRTMDVNFHTELPLGIVSGRVLEDGNSPAEGVEMKLVDQYRTTDADGLFEFGYVVTGLHTLSIVDGYIYAGSPVTDLDVERGDVLDVGNITVDSRPSGSLNVTVTSGGEPLPNAWVKVLSSELADDEFNFTTGEEGNVFIERVRSGAVNLRIGASHHTSKVDVANVLAAQTSNITVDLIEDPLPVKVGLTKEASPDVALSSSDLRITVPEEIVFSTLSVSLSLLNETGDPVSEISLLQPQAENDTSYLVRVQGQLPMESDFVFVVDDDLEADAGGMILWRDLEYRFSTEYVPDSFVTGVLLLEGSPVPGIDVQVGSFKDATDASGEFNITVNMDPDMSDASLVVNITDLGYREYSINVALVPGELSHVGFIDLMPLDDWYRVEPSHGTVDVEPSVDIVMDFMREVLQPEGAWSEVVGLTRQNTSAPVPGTYSLENDNRTIVFDPDSDLTENMEYTLTINDELLQKNGKSMFPAGNRTTFEVRSSVIEVTVISPEGIGSEPIDLDAAISLSFGTSVIRSKMEEALEMDPFPSSISFGWVSDSELRVEALFEPGTEYELSIQPGRYGTNDEVLSLSYNLQFSTGESYGSDHSFSSLNIIPEPGVGWETGQTITVSGSAPGSEGYRVTVSMDDELGSAVVGEDGTFTMEIVLPDDPEEGQMSVSIGVPNGPAAYSEDIQVDIREPGEQDGEDDEENNELLIVVSVAVVLLVLIIAAVAFMVSRKRKIHEETDIEYTEVEGDWSDPDEE